MGIETKVGGAGRIVVDDGKKRKRIHYSSFKLRVTVYRFMDERVAAELWQKAKRSSNPAYTISAYEKNKTFFFPESESESAILPLNSDSSKRMSGAKRTVFVWGKDGLDSPITGFQYTKQLGNAAATFSLRTKPVAQWGSNPNTNTARDMNDNTIYKYIDSGDWIQAELMDHGTWQTICVGKVDTVSLNISAARSGGASITIAGRGAGCVFSDTMLYFNPYDQAHANPSGAKMATILKRISGAPWQIVFSLLGLIDNEAATYGFPTLVPDGGLFTMSLNKNPEPFVKFSEVVQPVLKIGGQEEEEADTLAALGAKDISFADVLPQRGIIHEPTLLTPGQHTPLWDFVKTYGVPEFNDYYVVLRSTASYMGSRNTAPYDVASIKSKDLEEFRTTPDETQTDLKRMKQLTIDTAAKKELDSKRIKVVAREKPFLHIVDKSNWVFVGGYMGSKDPSTGLLDPPMAWKGLRRAEIYLSRVKRMSLARNTPRYNHIQVMMELPSNMNLDSFALCPPAANFYSIKRYGLKKLDMTLPLHAAYAKGDMGGLTQSLKRWRDIQICWNVLNPFYMSGTITIIGRFKTEEELLGNVVYFGNDSIPYLSKFTQPKPPNEKGVDLNDSGDVEYDEDDPRGKKKQITVVEEDDTSDFGGGEVGMSFYVEGVSYHVSAGRSPTLETTLTVSRGYLEVDREKDMKHLYAMWTDSTGMS